MVRKIQYLLIMLKQKQQKQVAETKTDEKLIVKINIVKKTGTQLFRLLPTLTWRKSEWMWDVILMEYMIMYLSSELHKMYWAMEKGSKC